MDPGVYIKEERKMNPGYQWFEHPAFAGAAHLQIRTSDARHIDTRMFEPIVEDMIVLVSDLKVDMETLKLKPFEPDPAKRQVLKRVAIPYFVGKTVTEADKDIIKKVIAKQLVWAAFQNGVAMSFDEQGMDVPHLAGNKLAVLNFVGEHVDVLRRLYKPSMAETDMYLDWGCNPIRTMSGIGTVLWGTNVWNMGVNREFGLRADTLQILMGFNPFLHAI